MRVLILSCNTGGGHNACGEAIRQAFEAAGDSCVTADALQFTSNKLSKFMSWGHTTMYRRLPKLFRFGYGYAENHPKMMQEDAVVVKLLTSGAEDLHSFLVASGYDIVICTHVFSGLLLRKALELYPMPIKTAFIATDYTCSPGTANSELDVYFIPDATLAEEFIAAGIPGGKLVASGMPVLSQFYIRGDKEKAKETFDIKPNNTHLLLMCGSMGCGPMKQLTEALSQRLEPNCEISVVCGTNQKLCRDLEQKYGNYPHIHIHGFVQDMSSLMDSADLYLTKPGGLSTSEALAKALPMVLIDAVAGCESYNLRHFTEMSGAVTAPNVEKLTALCLELLKDPQRRGKMETALLSHRYTDSADSICRVMHDWVNGGAQ